MQHLQHISRKIICGLFLVFLVFTTLSFLPEVGADGLSYGEAHAQEDSYQLLAPLPGVGDGESVDVTSDGSFPEYVNDIIALAIGFAILAAILVIIGAGIQYMTTTSKDGTSQAKERIGNALGGLILALAAFVILNTINPNLVQLNNVDTVTSEGGEFVEIGFGESGWCNYQLVDSSKRDNCYESLSQCSSEHYARNCYYYEGTGEYYEEEDMRGNQYCTQIDANVGDTYYCAPTKQACEEVEESTSQEHGENEVKTGCGFAYEATATYTNSETGETGEISSTKIGDSEAAMEACESVKDPTGGQYDQDYIDTCGGSGNRCEVAECSISQEEPETPISLNQKDWNEAVACPADQPAIGTISRKTLCSNNIAACESENNGEACYLHPTNMVKNGSANHETSCPDCVFLDRSRYNVKASNICSGAEDRCRLSTGLADKLAATDDSLGDSFPYEVTELFPPSVQHSSECHYNGDCVDLALRKDGGGQYSNNESGTQEHADKVVEFINKSEAQGASVTYEVGSDALMRDLIERGVPADKIITIPGLTPHFSVYETASAR